MEAAIARIDIRAQGQLSFLFSLIRQQPRSQWAPLLSKYVTFPMANNASDHALYKKFLEDNWRQWLWPFFERQSVHELLSKQEERNLFTVSMNLFAMVHHYVFMNQAESFGDTIQNTFAELQEFAGWDDESIMLARLMLYASANKITSSASVLKRDMNHPGWSNLFQMYSVVEHFIFCSPSAVMKLKSKAQCGFHVDEEGVFLDLLLIEQCMKILKDALKIETIVDQSESDKKLIARQKQLYKLGMENANYFLHLYSFFQTFEDGKASEEQKNEIIKMASSRNKLNKSQLKECIDSFSILLEQQKRNQQLAAAASVARRVYFKVNDTIQVRNEQPAQAAKSPNSKSQLLGAMKTKREVTLDNREASFDNVIPVLNVNSSGPKSSGHKSSEDSAKVIQEIKHELQQQPALGHQSPVDVAVIQNATPNEEALAPFIFQFTKLQAAFEDYKRILKLEQRAVFEVPEANKSVVAQREEQALALMKSLEQHLRSRSDELRTLGLQAMKKRDEAGADAKVDNGCSLQ